jgi:thymidylate kinase
MLILEGSDCLGKTTFAKLLLNEADRRNMYPTFYSHMSRPNSVFDFHEDYKDMITTYAIQDRFHLGGIVYHNAISQVGLEIIEGWLRSVGSVIVVFYAPDFDWYKDWIEKDNRGNLLRVDTMYNANKRFSELVLSKYGKNHLVPLIDFSIEIGSWPDRKLAKQIIDFWFERLSVL